MDIAAISGAQRERILKDLESIRDQAMSLAGVCLVASRGIRLGREDDAEALAEVIGQCAENHKRAQAIARELNG